MSGGHLKPVFCGHLPSVLTGVLLVFGHEVRFDGWGTAIGAALARGIREARPDVVLTECPGCRMQIEHLSGVAAWHPVRLLALAYGWTSPPFEETDHQKTGARLQ